MVVISNYLRADVIKELKDCKAIMRRDTGCHKIDVDYATERGIIISNLPEFASAVVPDHAMMLMLAAARELSLMQHATALRGWIRIRESEGQLQRGVSSRLTGLRPHRLKASVR